MKLWCLPVCCFFFLFCSSFNFFSFFVLSHSLRTLSSTSKPFVMILLLLFLRATLRLILLFKYRSRISTSPAVPSVDRTKAHAVPQDVIPSADGKPVAYKGARTGKIIRSLHGGELSNLIMPQCMCWRHTVVSLCAICLYVCLWISRSSWQTKCWYLQYRHNTTMSRG